eukprot:TRINITY_DN344_c0_g1_i4.p1 TRINITY_DN344_c0_g1~~TRINITY_DN344_c0_g1_i4.p1  ORF type:complete len:1002 (-),score=241.54 TRINITY_DN344_c0_g1_i4:131-3136(-)
MPLQVFCCLLAHQDQRLYEHLKSLPPALEVMICWHLTLFVGILPTESTLRLWDIALASTAGPKVLLRTSLALLVAHRSELLEAETPEQCKALLETAAKHSFDGSSLVKRLLNETVRVAWDQLQEWRLVVAAGATHLNLPLLVLPGVLEQGRSVGGEPGSPLTHGTITATAFGLTYSFYQGDGDLGPSSTTLLPYYGIMTMTKQDSPTETTFMLTMKDLRHFCFSVPAKSAQELNRILKSHCTPASVSLYAQQHSLYLAAVASANGSGECNQRADDMQRMLDQANQYAGGCWRLSMTNSCLALCETYPRRLLVPAAASDELLHQVAPFRSLGRIPTVSWLDVRPTRHRANCCPFVARSSQPLVGFWGQRSESDELLVKLMREAALAEDPEDNLVIIDCRDWLSACANASKGVIGRQAGGTEPTAAYGAKEVKFMSMQNIHKVRASLDQYEREDIAGLTSVEAIWNWLSHTRDLLSAAQQVVGLVDSGTSVLIHCSDGWDRTPQVVTLALVLLDPFYRTFEGLRVLVQREWVDFGHKFMDRTGREDEVGEERSPIFLQWISALHEVVCQAPNLFEFTPLLLLKLCDAHANGLLPGLLGPAQQPEGWDGNDELYSSWALLEQDRELWINNTFLPGTGSVPHNFYQRSAELLLEHSFVARWCLKRRVSPWALPAQVAAGAMSVVDGAQHVVLCQELKVALDQAEAQKVNAEQKAATLHGELEELLRERGHLMNENKMQAESLKQAIEEAEFTKQSLEDQKEKMSAIMSTPHLHLGILLQRALNESAQLLEPCDGALQGLWLLCALNNTNKEQPRILVLTDKVLLRVKYCFDVSSAPRVISHTRLNVHSDIVRLTAGQLQPYWSNKNRYTALRFQTAEQSPTFLQRWVTSVVWSGYPVQIYRSYVAEKCQPADEPMSGPLSVRSFIEKLKTVLEMESTALEVVHDEEIKLEAETQTVFRQTEFPPFWMCDTDMCNPTVSNCTRVDEVDEGEYSVVHLQQQVSNYSV